MTGGFLMAVIATVLVIVIAAPEYAEPVTGNSLISPSAAPSASASAEPAEAALLAPTSRVPTKLGGYRWPVRGGTVSGWYEWDKRGDFVTGKRRLRGGLEISWFCRPSSTRGAIVKAAHKGTVLATGTEWPDHAGFDGPVAYARLAKRSGGKLPNGIVIDDGNGYLSVYKHLDELLVKPGEKVKAGKVIGTMGSYQKVCRIEYQLVRADGLWMLVSDAARKAGWPDNARERVDPLAVLNLEARSMPRIKRLPPDDPPRLSEY